MRNIRAGLAAVAAFCLPSCTADDQVTVPDDDHLATPGLDDDFAAAERDHGVPADLLKAISYVETQWQMVDGQDEHDAGRQGSGLFALWGDNLVTGAIAAGVTEDAARHDLDANIATAAARLAQLASDRGITGGDLAAWAPVIGDFSQMPDDEVRTAYVTEVMRILAGGANAIAEDGTIVASIQPRLEIRPPAALEPNGLAVDFPGAIWRSSPNFSSRGTNVSLVVIHSCEGNYAGCWGWLRNTQAGASAHYVVKENGSEVTQLVREASRAWHVAATYECSRAGNQQCNRNGTGTNGFSVGIEHAGFASQSSWQNGLIETSAKLTCDITKDHNIPRDRNHIVSHGQLQPWNRTDPGPNWPWNHYIDRVRDHCGDGGGGGGDPIIVDSNNANNNQAVAKIELAGTWTSSASTSGYYGTGYWVGQTAQVSEPATFMFYLPAAATKSIDAWWTSGADRSTAAPFIAFNASGTEVGRKLVNQQGSASQWVNLGTWSFSAGWNKVVLSRWTSGSVVVADAVRVR